MADYSERRRVGARHPRRSTTSSTATTSTDTREQQLLQQSSTMTPSQAPGYSIGQSTQGGTRYPRNLSSMSTASGQLETLNTDTSSVSSDRSQRPAPQPQYRPVESRNATESRFTDAQFDGAINIPYDFAVFQDEPVFAGPAYVGPVRRPMPNTNLTSYPYETFSYYGGQPYLLPSQSQYPSEGIAGPSTFYGSNPLSSPSPSGAMVGLPTTYGSNNNPPSRTYQQPITASQPWQRPPLNGMSIDPRAFERASAPRQPRAVNEYASQPADPRSNGQPGSASMYSDSANGNPARRPRQSDSRRHRPGAG